MRTRYMNEGQVERTLDRLAHEIIERNRGVDKLVIVGIRTTGATLAHRVAERINSIEKSSIRSIDLDVTPFRDDHPYQLVESGLPDLTGKAVLLVDDVLFTGRTARAALDAVVRSGRPASIQLLVLIDRGHREYPIQPDYVGRVMPTKHKERVEVDSNASIVDIVE
ncbi:MAG: bifunctional pyr operon transcriptional regulator/uracil phosphoribosyltransferase PyrR [Bacteroidetes bacterium]|nr:bifunctional pyr operon transcriptional regulator/uracil phosphoribosyltransferase PyrR [Bacteroidota bacterium]